MTQKPNNPNLIVFKLKYGRLFLDLFLHPLEAQACAAQLALWGRGLSLVLLISIAFSLGDAVIAFPALSHRCSQASAFISRTVGTISLVDEKLEWEHDEALPVTGHLNDFRIDLTRKADDITDAILARETSDSGLIVAHDDILYWKRLPFESEEKSITKVYVWKKLMKLMESGSLPMQFTASELLALSQTFCLSMLPMLAAGNAFEKLRTIFFCVFFFTFFQLIFKRGNWAQLGQIVSLGLHACLPPLVMAGIYGLTGAFSMQFETAFWIALILYMLLIFFRRQAMLTVEKS